MSNSDAAQPYGGDNLPEQAEPFEIWGGVECTCNRVGDTWLDQSHASGHAHRLNDYEAFAAIGLRTLRCGLLWEQYEREQSWRSFDERLACIRAVGIRPIAGLLHHGSGPPQTSLLDPDFPGKLAGYARAFAEHYPWIDAYTPVNEPNTTARFSCLYGVWYPHRRSRQSYLRALLHQLKATVLSMEAIRQVRPEAQLILTEDAGRIFATPELAETSQILNLRRWLSFDLLCGLVDRHHPMSDYMAKHGIQEKEILWFSDRRTPPDVVGLNYYVTSDRFLDHRRELYPESCGSAEGPFVDVEAVRALPSWRVGFSSILEEAWSRYQIPVALTEVHLGCTVEEQIRWAAQAWQAMVRAQQAGVRCRALTFWALLGSWYWNELVTRANGHYEAGLFDVSSGPPRPTELARLAAHMASGHAPSHPAMDSPGWWEYEDRICFRSTDELSLFAA